MIKATVQNDVCCALCCLATRHVAADDGAPGLGDFRGRPDEMFLTQIVQRPRRLRHNGDGAVGQEIGLAARPRPVSPCRPCCLRAAPFPARPPCARGPRAIARCARPKTRRTDERPLASANCLRPAFERLQARRERRFDELAVLVAKLSAVAINNENHAAPRAAAGKAASKDVPSLPARNVRGQKIEFARLGDTRKSRRVGADDCEEQNPGDQPRDPAASDPSSKAREHRLSFPQVPGAVTCARSDSRELRLRIARREIFGSHQHAEIAWGAETRSRLRFDFALNAFGNQCVFRKFSLCQVLRDISGHNLCCANLPFQWICHGSVPGFKVTRNCFGSHFAVTSALPFSARLLR